MPGCGEPGHVDTDLSDDCLRGELTAPGGRLEKLSRRLERDDTLHDLSGEGLDRVIEEVDVSEDLTGHGAVVSDPTTLERFDQIRDLGSHTSLGQLREPHGVFLTGDEHLDHRPDRKSTPLNSSHSCASRMPSSAC